MNRLETEAFKTLGRIKAILEADLEGQSSAKSITQVATVMCDFEFVHQEEKALRHKSTDLYSDEL